MELTQEYLKSILKYDPETGLFIRLVRTCNSVKVGDVAGSTKGSHGYVGININRTIYLAHRLAWFYMLGQWPERHIDHINRARTDNRWSNLREATPQQNLSNRPAQINNKSGLKGVSADKKKWAAHICKNGRRMYLGNYETPEQAHSAYCRAADRLFGEFANHEPYREFTDDLGNRVGRGCE